MTYTTIKDFCRRHGVNINTLYRRAKTAKNRGVVLEKIDKSPVYRESDLLSLVPPLWQDRRRNVRKKE